VNFTQTVSSTTVTASGSANWIPFLAKGENYAVDTGAVNAIVVALSPPATSYSDGLFIRFRVGHTNTAGCSINAGGGAVAILNDTGNPMQPGDLLANAVVTVVYSTIYNAFILISLAASQVILNVPYGAGAMGPIGSSTVVPVITIDDKGRVIGLGSVGISTSRVPLGYGLHSGGAGGQLMVSGVISSITRTSTGLYVVNFSPSFADTNYVCLITRDSDGGDNQSMDMQSKTAASYTFLLHRWGDSAIRADSAFSVMVWHA
jgi:hypothetical protein